ncbi:MAG: diguanylate cyclase [Planctomycetes bacterium]|nr:diguanylate cyclase [Planctomycetota bacterium]
MSAANGGKGADQPDSDPRLPAYREATRRIAKGFLPPEIPIGERDEIGLLGEEIAWLGQAIKGRFLTFRRLNDLVEFASSGDLLKEILDRVFESFGNLIPFDRIGAALIEPGGETARSIYARSKGTEIHIPVGYSAPLAGSSLAQIVASGKPRIINDLAAYLEEHPDSESTRHILAEGIRSSLTCPLFSRRRPVGFLFFSSQKPGTYSHEHTDMFILIAGQIGNMIDKSLLYEDLLETKRKLEAANAQLERLASLDGLTGILNRRSFDQRLQEEWNRGIRTRSPISVLFVDIDHFKNYNDLHGHLAGDDCLKTVAKVLESSVKRSADFTARFGGEEFVAVLPGVELEGACDVARRIRRDLETLSIRHGASPVSEILTISVGVASAVPSRYEQPEDLVARADAALYKAKENGRNRVECPLAHESREEISTTPPTAAGGR